MELIMKKYLITKTGNFYKANLHCHSNLSDGKLTVQEIKDSYIKQGYSVVAFTDHDVFLPHPELESEDFLPLNGFELEINEAGKPWINTRTCHLCFISLDLDNKVHPLWHRSDYLFGNAVSHREEVIFDRAKPDFVRSYTPECINEMMRIGRENHFFVTYNHPRWSLETLEQYGKYVGMNAMEIYNHGCYTSGYDDYAPAVYDEILRTGNRIYCIAADDNHNGSPFSSPHCDSFGGFTMIKAEKLDYKSIAEALKNGNFYASRGPEISELVYDTEEKTVSIRCKDAAKIVLSTGVRRQQTIYPDCQAHSLNEAAFKLSAGDIYFRISIYDEKGRTADTNAYFLDSLL